MFDIDDITIVICSNRSKKLRQYSTLLIKRFRNLCRVMIVLDSEIDTSYSNIVNCFKDFGNVTVLLSESSGLSYLRNKALAHCKTRYILFIDDDVTLDVLSVYEIIKKLRLDNGIVGLRLKPPHVNYVKRWHITSNQYHYLGLHSDDNVSSIWGACMAFDSFVIKSNNLIFPINLGRRGKIFLSGEDTFFISFLIRKGVPSILLDEYYFAVHHVDSTRMCFFAMVRRVFWQGITEVIRCNFPASIQKELKRNLSRLSLTKLLIGCMWLGVFLFGILWGFLLKILRLKL